MKVKIFALVAAFFMLMGGSAWAQSDVKGDVNKDGVVNEQDIAAILAIMAKNNGVAEKTRYYWYAGQTQPTSLTTNPTPSAEFTCNNWFEIGTTLPTSIVQRVTGGVSGNIWYAAVPSSANLRPTATDNTTTDTSITKLGNITVNNIQYDVWKCAGVTATRYTAIFNK